MKTIAEMIEALLQAGYIKKEELSYLTDEVIRQFFDILRYGD